MKTPVAVLFAQWRLSRYRSLVDKLALGIMVLNPRASHDEVRPFWSKANGVLFAGLRHGVPLVAFDVGSLRDYLPEGVGKVVPLGDLDAFASVVETIEPSSSARDRVLAVAERYLWSHTVLPVLNEYKGQSR